MQLFSCFIININCNVGMYILQECFGLRLGYVRLVLVLHSTPILKII